MRNQHLKKSPEKTGYMTDYSGALAKNLTDILERRFDALGFDPWLTLIEIARDPKAENRDKIDAVKTMLPFLYARKKQVDVTSKKEVTTRYVIEVPALPDHPNPRPTMAIDVTPSKSEDDDGN